MTTVISLTDGTSMEVLSVMQGREYISGSERDFLEIKFDGSTTEYSTVKELYDNPDNFKLVQCTETIEDGSSTIDYTDYIIPVNIISKNENDMFTITLRIARKTEEEKSKETLVQENEKIKLALAELAINYAELETRLNKLEGVDDTTSETTTAKEE